MEKSQILTADEIASQVYDSIVLNCNCKDCKKAIKNKKWLIKQIIIRNTYYVNEALKSAAEKAKWKRCNPRMSNMDGVEIDKESILKSYNLDNIK